jgi:hypothetical protein
LIVCPITQGPVAAIALPRHEVGEERAQHLLSCNTRLKLIASIEDPLFLKNIEVIRS